MKVNVIGGEMSQEEIQAYAQEIRKKHPGEQIDEMTIKIDGDYVDIESKLSAIPFQRIRRITGYLVGTLDRFNDGKRAEEHDRVKHGVEEEA
jgi:hypothetical protein